MSAVSAFKLVLLSLIAIIALELLAKRLRLPPAAALLVGGAAMATVVTVVLSRCVWTFGLEAINALLHRISRRIAPRADWRSACVVSWAGMRGVVTLAIALSLPEAMPGRDLILFSAFVVILFTVLLQGTTIGMVIRLVRPASDTHASAYLNEMQAWARLEAAQLEAIKPLVYAPDGSVLHPRLLEQYSYRARLTDEFQHAPSFPQAARHAHYDVILAAIAAGRAELLRMHRGGLIHDDLLHAMEHDLDLQEMSSRHARG